MVKRYRCGNSRVMSNLVREAQALRAIDLTQSHSDTSTILYKYENGMYSLVSPAMVESSIDARIRFLKSEILALDLALTELDKCIDLLPSRVNDGRETNISQSDC